MAHFLDKLVAQKFEGDLYFREFIDLLPKAEMFKAENVFNYFHASKKHRPDGRSGRIEVHLNDFPAVAPPFPVFFVDGGSDIGKKEDGVHDEEVWSERGCLFVARPIMAEQHKAFSHILQHGGIWASRLTLKQAGVEWVLYVIPFMQLKNMLFPPLICSVILVEESGKIYVGNNTDPSKFMTVLDEKNIPQMTTWLKPTEENLDLFQSVPIVSAHDYEYFYSSLTGKDKIVATFLCKLGSLVEWPSLLTLCFLHCRNVEIIEHDPLITRQLRRQSERRKEKTGYGLIKFRTLQIDPIKKILREEGQVESKGLGVALHICRGHFKDYRDGKGVFGKGNGLYWWDSQVRGSAEHGTVLKDYKLAKIKEE